MENLPIIIQWGAISVGVVGSAFGFYKAGVDRGAKKNGYVTKVDCKANVNQMTNSIEDLHKKTNEALIGIGKIEGFLER